MRTEIFNANMKAEATFVSCYEKKAARWVDRS